jgi:hypothetical protein
MIINTNVICIIHELSYYYFSKRLRGKTRGFLNVAIHNRTTLQEGIAYPNALCRVMQFLNFMPPQQSRP